MKTINNKRVLKLPKQRIFEQMNIKIEMEFLSATELIHRLLTLWHWHESFENGFRFHYLDIF